MNYSLRPATTADHDFLCDLGRITMREYVEQTWGAWDEALYREQFDATFDPAAQQIIVVDGTAAGVVWVRHFPDYDYLNRIYILPEFQNRGIGTAVLKQLIESANANDRPLELRVLKSNPRAQQLYERLGFTVYVSIEHHHMLRCSPSQADDSG